ncbi:MAG: ANTAR domain-containing protein [Peptococcaceae bacterium]|nr:MAG: ANTAR domain-containing protein [Peptococcaceae bacterium]
MFGTRVVVADADVVFRKKLKEILSQAGYLVVGEVGDGRSALKVVFQNEPDLVIMDSQLPGLRSLEVAGIIEEHRAAPVILLASEHELEVLDEDGASRILGYLVKPVCETSLIPVLEIAIANFRKMLKLEQENKKLKETLEARRVVEKAKGILMRGKNLSEEDAYRHLRKQSMDRCIPMARVAKELIAKAEGKT